MTESELVQASASWAALAYTSSQWWLTVTTALVVGTYLAARHIPIWLFALIAVLYVLTAVSVVFEVSEYSELSLNFGLRVTQLQIANREIGATSEPSGFFRHLNLFLNYSIFTVGSFGALAFSFLHWREARRASQP